ncbi:hypothetical protein DPMN_042183 [Dreissena polymorpha]|uniref:Uncharacterized protein n=1 Tax=Dreissena polymorpha TaxID=45954 RepID=A0A9D4D1L8_DREPO|nr:hypothetical protein DPMN_042183 [Dreissena polymorpha]
MDTFIALSNITANVTTTSTVPSVQTSRKKAVVVGVAVTSGLIVLALISCLAFCIVRRFRRKNQPKDDEVNVGCRTDENSGFKHALSRKMTTFYNKIRVDRPLPSIPKSIRRLKQRPLPIDLRELRQSGVYNSIKETSHPIETNDSSSHLDAHKPVVMSQGSSAGVMNSLDRLKVHGLALNTNKLKNEPIVKYPLSAKSTQSDGADAVAVKEAKDIAHKMCCRENDYDESACYITHVGEPIDDAIESNCYMNTVQKVDHGFRKFDQNHLKTPGGGIQKESLKIIGKSGTSERLCSVSLFSVVSTPVNCVDRGDLDNSNFYVHPGKVALVETRDYSAKVYENLAFETHEQTGEIATTENTRVQGSNDEGHVFKMPVGTVDSCGYVPMGEMNRDATACGRDATSCGSSASVITPDLMLLAVSGHCNSESDTCYSEDDEVSSPFASTSFETLQTGSHVSSSDVLSIPARKSKRLDSGYQSDTSKCITMRNATPDDLFPNLIQFRGIDASLKRSAPLAKPDGNHGRGKVKVKRYIRPKAAQTDISP